MPVYRKPLPPKHVIDEWVEYADGHLFWVKKPYRGHLAKSGFAEDEGRYSRGYKKTSIPGHGRFLTHRIIWAIHNNDIPPNMWIDHINQNKRDNRIENLKLVSWADNQRNTKAKNKTGLPKFVHKTVNGRYAVLVRIGTYDTVEEAARAADIIPVLLQEAVAAHLAQVAAAGSQPRPWA
jgi:Drexlerviridae HNH endonuclease